MDPTQRDIDGLLCGLMNNTTEDLSNLLRNRNRGGANRQPRGRQGAPAAVQEQGTPKVDRGRLKKVLLEDYDIDPSEIDEIFEGSGDVVSQRELTDFLKTDQQSESFFSF